MKNNRTLFSSASPNHCSSLDGLRAISCVGIMLMHVLANTNYAVSGFIYDKMIPSFTHFVILFLMISGFGMCVGYLQKFIDKQIDLETFYVKRYKRLLPYYVFLIVIALIVEPSAINFFDATIEITMIYGLLPNNALNLIGVGWTVGVIFLFYLFFPAYSVLLKSKRRAWCSFCISLWIALMCRLHYFSDYYVNALFTPRHSFLYCLPFFIFGGIVFLYKEQLKAFLDKKILRFCASLIICLGVLLYFLFPNYVNSYDITFEKNLILFGSILVYFVGVESKLMGSKILKFFGDMSMEIYLSHMFVFRTYEKLGILYKFGDGWLGYWIVCILVLAGVVALILGYRLFIDILKYTIIKSKNLKRTV